ncbi:HAD family hydrolase [Georgenia sp. SUBG003]|uniref:HAD family hydrolase n=1 Tax=Georgenia sp. SUBG003 TaxID=1497974 RepID=UPI003AB40B21
MWSRRSSPAWSRGCARRGRPGGRGALEILAELRSAGVPCALVTMSYESFAGAVVAAAPAGTFQEVVTGDQVTRGKPHPEAYLTAAERLGVDPARCIAVEDSTVGVTAALASGARTIAVPLMVQVAAQDTLSRLRSLEGVGLDLLARILAGEVVDELATVGRAGR